MQIVSARDFRTNQGRYLTAAREGQDVILTSRYGSFKLTPVTAEDSLSITDRILRGLKEVKMIQEGKLPRRTIEDLLNEL